MKKILFVAIVLSAASFIIADTQFLSAKECSECDVASAQSKGRWWDCPRCGTMNSVSSAYCKTCGMRQR